LFGDLLGHTTSLEILPNGYLAYLGANKIIRFLDYQNDFYDVSAINKTFIVTKQDNAQLRMLSNNRLASASEDKKIKIWNITDYKHIKTFISNNEIDYLLFLSDSLLDSAGSYQSIMQIWNLTNYQLVNEKNFKNKVITSMTSLYSKYLAIGFDNSYIHIMNITDYSLINQIELDSYPIQLAFLPNEYLVAITSSAIIYVLDPINNQIIKSFQTDIKIQLYNAIHVNSLEVINDKYIAVSEIGYLKIYDLFNQGLVIKKEFFSPDTGHGESIFSIKYIKNGNYLVHTHSKSLKNIFIYKVFFE
jgi:WD40 repeat protein